MKIKHLLIVSVFAICLMLPSFVSGAEEPVKIGDITTYTGEVLARTKGVWVKVKSAPHPIYSDDKVVTRRGRAEIGFIDGGVMRLDLDSNISIEQTTEEEGFAFKNKVSTRQVNLMVGKLWFSVKMEKGNKLNVRTPTMTAAVRGSSATIEQGPKPDQPAKYSFHEGHIDTEGSFQPVKLNIIKTEDIHVNAADLPSSNPQVDKSPVQKAAVQAAEKQSKARQAASKAGEETEVAKAVGDQASKSQATDDKLEAAKKKAQANNMKAEAAVLDKEAKMLSEQEKMLEAKAFKETDEANKIQNNIKQLGNEVSKLQVQAKKLKEIKTKVDKAAKSGNMGAAQKALDESEQIMNDIPKVTPPPAEVGADTKTDETANAETQATTAREDTQELGYTEDAPPPATVTAQTLPDTQDLGTSSPAQ